MLSFLFFLQIIIVCKFRVNRNKIVSSLSLHHRDTGIETWDESSPQIEQCGTTLFTFSVVFGSDGIYKVRRCWFWAWKTRLCTGDVKNDNYSCYTRHMKLIVRVGGMPWYVNRHNSLLYTDNIRTSRKSSCNQ